MAEIRLGYLNAVTLLGRATQDPDLRYTPKGTAVLGFRIALSRRYKDRETDEWKGEDYFFNVNLWGQQAERIGETMKKGSAVLVEGELRSRTWETQTGDKRYVVEVHARRVQVLDKYPTQGQDAGPDEQPPVQPDATADQLDDIPF